MVVTHWQKAHSMKIIMAEDSMFHSFYGVMKLIPAQQEIQLSRCDPHRKIQIFLLPAANHSIEFTRMTNNDLKFINTIKVVISYDKMNAEGV